jgi:hypothetical protein
VAVVEAAEVEVGHALEHGRQARVVILDGVAQAIAGGVEVGEQALDVVLGRVAAGGAFDRGEDAGQVSVQAFVVLSLGGYVDEQLAWVDEVALGLDCIVLDVCGDDAVGQFRLLDTVVAGLDVACEVLADETIEERAEDVLLEVPAIHGAAYVVGDLPDLALQGGALLGACHSLIPEFTSR